MFILYKYQVQYRFLVLGIYSNQYTLFAISLVLSVKKRKKKEKTFLAACIRLYYIALANRHRNHFGQTPKHFEPEMGENGKVVTLEISSQLLELYASIKRRTFAFRTMHNSEIVFHHQWSLLCLLLCIDYYYLFEIRFSLIDY